MRTSLKYRLSGLAAGMSPRALQWATIGALAAAAIAILWAVFAMGSGGTAQRAAASSAKGDLKPTNVDLMAPGAQVKPEEVWIGKAGREMDLYKQEREDQRRINRERREQQEVLMRRFAELEAKFKAAPPAEPANAASSPSTSPPPAPPGTAYPANWKAMCLESAWRAWRCPFHPA